MPRSEKLLDGIKVLVMGLGLHGGGVATVKWLAREGAIVTATDKRTKEVLASSVKALKGLPILFTLGEHDKKDFLATDIVVVNPGVPRESEFLSIAKKAGKKIVNDTSLFFVYDQHVKIAVTGTRGKTTTTQFIAELLQKKYPDALPSGNTPANALLREYLRIKHKDVPVVAELSSWQLEYLPTIRKAPHIALITNLFPDHLNRYSGMNDYANAKAGIFQYQQEGDYLILNKDNAWCDYFVKKKPKSIVFYVSLKPLKKNECGIYLKNNKLFFQADKIVQELFSVKKFIIAQGMHNLENLMGAVLAVKLFDPALHIVESDIQKLTTPLMRQEVVYQKKNLRIINDSCATSPDGTIVAIKRFIGEQQLVIILGGTNKDLKYNELAKLILKNFKQEDVVLLEGSATQQLVGELGKFSPRVCQTLSECVDYAVACASHKKGKTTILFSPGAASFEKFLHEFDRGAQFNKLIKKSLTS